MMLRTTVLTAALCTLLVPGEPDDWNSESCFLQVNYDLAEHDTPAAAVAAGNGSLARGLQTAAAGLPRTPTNLNVKSLLQDRQNASSNASALTSLNATTRDVSSTARLNARAHAPSSCTLFLGVPKIYWAMICDALGIAMLLLCIPFLLQCSRRRSVGASIFDFVGRGSQPQLKPPPFVGHVRAGLTANREAPGQTVTTNAGS